MTVQEYCNLLKVYAARDTGGQWYCFTHKPIFSCGTWSYVDHTHKAKILGMVELPNLPPYASLFSPKKDKVACSYQELNFEKLEELYKKLRKKELLEEILALEKEYRKLI